MEEVNNITAEELNELIKDFPVKPRHNRVIITLNTEIDEEDIQLSSNMMSETQYVVAVGGMVRDLEPGDRVIIDLEKLLHKELNPNNQSEDFTQVKIDPIQVGDRMFTFVSDSVIKAIDERIELDY